MGFLSIQSFVCMYVCMYVFNEVGWSLQLFSSNVSTNEKIYHGFFANCSSLELFCVLCKRVIQAFWMPK
jgi:hypothetical protein